jgi:phosphogluconate dehydratase
LVRTGDRILLDANAGLLEAQVPAEVWADRKPAQAGPAQRDHGFGRELFGHARAHVSGAESGASVFWPDAEGAKPAAADTTSSPIVAAANAGGTP